MHFNVLFDFTRTRTLKKEREKSIQIHESYYVYIVILSYTV